MSAGSLALVQVIVGSVEENPDKLQAIVKMFLQRDETASVVERISTLVTLLRNNKHNYSKISKSSNQLSAIYSVRTTHFTFKCIC